MIYSALCPASLAQSKKPEKSPTSTTAAAAATATTTTPTNALDPKKTCNLESYLDWSARLRTLVANEVLLVSALMRIITNAKTNIRTPLLRWLVENSATN